MKAAVRGEYERIDQIMYPYYGGPWGYGDFGGYDFSDWAPMGGFYDPYTTMMPWYGGYGDFFTGIQSGPAIVGIQSGPAIVGIQSGPAIVGAAPGPRAPNGAAQGTAPVAPVATGFYGPWGYGGYGGWGGDPWGYGGYSGYGGWY